MTVGFDSPACPVCRWSVVRTSLSARPYNRARWTVLKRMLRAAIQNNTGLASELVAFVEELWRERLQVIAPGLISQCLAEGRKAQIGDKTGAPGPTDELQTGLPWRPIALPGIARTTAGREILPRVRSAPLPGNDMVNGQVPCFPATVLAPVIVPGENGPARQLHLRQRPVNIIVESDNTGHLDFHAGGMKSAVGRFHRRRLPGKYQRHGPLPAADVEGLVVLVDDQYLAIHANDWPPVDTLINE